MQREEVRVGEGETKTPTEAPEAAAAAAATNQAPECFGRQLAAAHPQIFSTAGTIDLDTQKSVSPVITVEDEAPRGQHQPQQHRAVQQQQQQQQPLALPPGCGYTDAPGGAELTLRSGLSNAPRQTTTAPASAATAIFLADAMDNETPMERDLLLPQAGHLLPSA